MNADVLVKIIRAAKYTNKMLLKDAGLSRDALDTWANGTRNPSDESIEKLAEALRNRSKAFAEMADLALTLRRNSITPE